MPIEQFLSGAPWFRRGEPDVGTLLALCEENYALLMRLVPQLQVCTGCLRAIGGQDLDLHLDIIEQARYTTTLRLTYFFHAGAELVADPDACLRAYHDAGQVEVLNLRQNLLAPCNGYAPPALLDKWRVNLFLSKWLSFCVHQGYRVVAAKAPEVGLRPPTKPVGLPG